jgi:PKD repeat protein
MSAPDPEPTRRARTSAGPDGTGASNEIPVGPFILRVGDDAGTEARLAHDQAHIPPAGTQGGSDGRASSDARTLAASLRASDREQRRGTAPELLESATDKASQVTTKVEHANTLCQQVISGEISLDSIGAETDAVVALLGRLDRAGRWEEELRLARCASKLLSLARRWLELLRVLRAALRAAERIGDANARAWALHELGTLRLAADDHAQADELLGRACELRERCGDQRGRALTERNLQILCRSMRARLHRRRSNRLREALRKPIPALAAAAVLLAAGGSAGAVIDHSSGSHRTTSPTQYGPGRHLATVTVSFSPLEPRAGEPVRFRAAATDRADPVAAYKWDFGDDDPSRQPGAAHTSRLHIYRRAGTFKLVVLVSDAQRKTIGEASASISVLPKRAHKPGPVPRPKPDGGDGGGGGEAPTAKFTFSPSSPAVGQQVAFDASQSSPGAGSIISYRWNFDDHSAPAPGHQTASHVYARAERYEVTLTVTNDRGKTDTTTHLVPVGEGSNGRTPKLTLRCPGTLPFEADAKVSGALSPVKVEAMIHITFIPPSGEPRTSEVPTSTDGTFEAKTTADRAGTWEVHGEWGGEELARPARETCSFYVQPPNPALHR